jgi:hypothetical protein
MSAQAGLGSTVAQARTSLVDACAALDDAVRLLVEPDGQTVMASDEIVALLVHVVSARRLLVEIERAAPAPERTAARA